MEKQDEQSKIVLSRAEAEEYCAFKRRKRAEEVRQAFLKTELQAELPLKSETLKTLFFDAKKLRVAAVKLTPNFVAAAHGTIGADAIIGGTGETTSKVKFYEAKRAIRDGASELTLILSETLTERERTGELKREIKKLSKLSSRALLKIATPKNASKQQILSLASLVSEVGVKMLSVPYFIGAEDLKSEIGARCMLEITDVADVATYKTLLLSGVERIATKNGNAVYEALMKEAEQCDFSSECFLTPLSPFRKNGNT